MEKLINSNYKESALREDIIFAEKETLNLMDQKIQDLESELVTTTQDMGESANNDSDLRENYDFRDLRLRATDELPKKISKLKEKKEKIVVFPETKDTNLINLGDTFTVEMFYSDENITEVNRFHLVGPLEVEFDSDNCIGSKEDIPLQNISYLSPLGRSAWGADCKKGSQFRYKIGVNEVTCTLI